MGKCYKSLIMLIISGFLFIFLSFSVSAEVSFIESKNKVDMIAELYNVTNEISVDADSLIYDEGNKRYKIVWNITDLNVKKITQTLDFKTVDYYIKDGDYYVDFFDKMERHKWSFKPEIELLEQCNISYKLKEQNKKVSLEINLNPKKSGDYPSECLLLDPVLDILIIQSLHLDKEYNVLNDITELTKRNDDMWSEPIYHNEFVRVKFIKILSKYGDITLKSWNNNSFNDTYIQVYHKNSSYLITEFPVIRGVVYFKKLLLHINQSSDTFDLKVVNKHNNSNAYLIFDHIIDPPVVEYLSGIPVIIGSEKVDYKSRKEIPICHGGKYLDYNPNIGVPIVKPILDDSETVIPDKPPKPKK